MELTGSKSKIIFIIRNDTNGNSHLIPDSKWSNSKSDKETDDKSIMTRIIQTQELSKNKNKIIHTESNSTNNRTNSQIELIPSNRPIIALN
jgi:hypothetical protein